MCQGVRGSEGPPSGSQVKIDNRRCLYKRHMDKLLAYFIQLFRTTLSEDPSFTVMHSTSSVSVEDYIITISVDKRPVLGKRSHTGEQQYRQTMAKTDENSNASSIAMKDPQYVSDTNLYNTFGHGY